MSRRKQKSCANRTNNHADFPFKVKIDTPEEEQHTGIQKWPFDPSGLFEPCQSLDVIYTIMLHKQWTDMIDCGYVLFKNINYRIGDFVYVANDKCNNQEGAANEGPKQPCELQLSDHWVANILEIKALDKKHVYVRVCWMYSPDDLPPDALDGLKVGRQPYHGQKELIASNHMDVIEVATSAGHAAVYQWAESKGNPTQDVFYWRQAFDCWTQRLFFMHTRGQTENSITSGPAEVESDSAECQTDTLLRPAVHKDERESQLSENGDCDPSPQQVSTSIHAPPGASMLESPHLPRAMRRLHIPTDYSASSESDLQMAFFKSSSRLIASASPSDILVSSTGASSAKAQLPLGYPRNAPLTSLSTAFPLASYGDPPLKTQHRLLTSLQSVLELACYIFGERIMPKLFLSLGWDCAERVQLNKWTGILEKEKRFSSLKIAGKSAKEFFRSTANIRHYAVRRQQVSIESLEEFFVDAETLVTLFEDDKSKSQVIELWQGIAVPDLKCNAVLA